MKLLPEKSRLLALSCGLAILYGLAAYSFFLSEHQLGSFSYIALVPIAMASIAFVFDDPAQLDLFRRRMFVPWVVTIGLFCLLFAARVEALLCAVMLAAPCVVIFSLWYWIAHALRLRKDRKLREAFKSVLILMLLPFATVQLEPGRATLRCSSLARTRSAPA